MGIVASVKMTDPTSVVKLSEAETVESNVDIPDRIKQWWGKNIDDTGRLLPEARASLFQSAQATYLAHADGILTKRNDYIIDSGNSLPDPDRTIRNPVNFDFYKEAGGNQYLSLWEQQQQENKGNTVTTEAVQQEQSAPSILNQESVENALPPEGLAWENLMSWPDIDVNRLSEVQKQRLDIELQKLGIKDCLLYTSPSPRDS